MVLRLRVKGSRLGTKGVVSRTHHTTPRTQTHTHIHTHTEPSFAVLVQTKRTTLGKPYWKPFSTNSPGLLESYVMLIFNV